MSRSSEDELVKGAVKIITIGLGASALVYDLMKIPNVMRSFLFSPVSRPGHSALPGGRP